ncbi:MAG: SLATT domain-containing protein [Bacteroidales bacterium]|nr:SLATT domain-containing protein [Bacteroidales bacterium]
MTEISNKKLYQQIVDAAANIQYTYTAHWTKVNSLQATQTCIKITQIVLTALSTGGFLASLISDIPWLSWIGGMTSAIALALNLYSLNFNLPADIKAHTDAANELWDVKESYKSLITDFNNLSIEEIRSKRDSLTHCVSQINKKYPGTDNKAFAKAKKKLPNYMFENGESAKLLNICENEDEA